MLQGIGIDITPIKRFRNLKNRKAFLRNFLSDRELAGAVSINNTNRYLATLFALKEAVMKALHMGLKNGSNWHDIRIHKDFKVALIGSFKKIRDQRTRILVTKSSSEKYAVGLALIQK